MSRRLLCARGLRRQFVEVLLIVGGKASEMAEAELRGDVADTNAGRRRHQESADGIQSDRSEIRGRRRARDVLKAVLQRPATDLQAMAEV